MRQLLGRWRRTAALALGVLVAATGFTLLTGDVTTGTVRVKGTIARNWHTAYDLLVRPRGSYTTLEKREGLVRDNYLSGIYGGISFSQYREIKNIPGVSVAAPIGNIGYVFFLSLFPVRLNRYIGSQPSQVLRVDESWLANQGASVYPGETPYVFFTRKAPLRGGRLIEGKQTIPVCSGVRRGQETAPLFCFSSRSPSNGYKRFGLGPHDVGIGVVVEFPMLLSAIDPVQEQRLLGLKHTVVAGRYLRATDGVRMEGSGNRTFPTIPVVAASRTYVDDSLRLHILRLQTPGLRRLATALASRDRVPFLKGLHGSRVATETVPAAAMYPRALALGSSGKQFSSVGSVRSVSPVHYRVLGRRSLRTVPTRNPRSVWRDPVYVTLDRDSLLPPDNHDTQFRRITDHPSLRTLHQGEPSLRVVGTFDPARLPGFSRLSRVPLESYYPPVARPANAASRKALHGRDLGPTMNLGGYLAQPPLLFTDLRVLRLMAQHYGGAHPSDPISVIRVRVRGVTHPTQVTQQRLRSVALAIRQRTGLAVDITAGSSPQRMKVTLPRGRFGQPRLSLTEQWVRKGVAIRFLQALDKKSGSLFLLIVVASAMFLGNAALAAIRVRRSEFGTLRCMGWRDGEVFRAAATETIAVGLIAGAVGSGLAALLVWLLGLHLPLLSALLVIPIGAVIATVAGLLPAGLAARGDPLDAVRPPAAEMRGSRRAGGLPALAIIELVRLPGRSLLGAAGMFLGVGALTVLLVLNEAFHSTLVGTLLGEVISTQVRAVDYATVALVIVLGAASVADVTFMNLYEQRAELAALRACGWSNREIATLVTIQGACIGAAGTLIGALVGGVVGGLVRGVDLGAVAMAGFWGCMVGFAVTVAASALVATVSVLQDLPTIGAVLAEE